MLLRLWNATAILPMQPVRRSASDEAGDADNADIFMASRIRSTRRYGSWKSMRWTKLERRIGKT
jgi:hypothetical protein